MIDNHTATQHEFTRRCLRLFSEDIPPVKRQKLEEDLPVFAEGINHLGGYNLDRQLAALTAERDEVARRGHSLRALVQRLSEIGPEIFDNWDEVEGWKSERLAGLLADCQTILDTGETK